jgi:hypothetical protein
MADADFKRRRVVFLEQQQNLNSLNQQLAARPNQLTETRYSLAQLPTVMAGKSKVYAVSSRRSSSVSLRSVAAALMLSEPRLPGAFQRCRPPWVNLRTRGVCRWKSFQTTAFCERSCLYRPEP